MIWSIKKSVILCSLSLLAGCSLRQNSELDSLAKSSLSSHQNILSKDFMTSTLNPPEDSINAECASSKVSDSIEKLSLVVPKSRRWVQNLLKAKLDKGDVIRARYKKRFYAELYFQDKNQNPCKIISKIRISGDWKDHIVITDETPKTSIDIHFANGSFKGISKLKLLLPPTRNGDGEIFVATLMRSLGFLSPRTFYVDLSVNGGRYMRYIAQEKPAKELLEFNGLRESAILETDEDLFWRAKKLGLSESNVMYTPKVINSAWLKRNPVNLDIGFNAYLHMLSPLLDASFRSASFDDSLLCGESNSCRDEMRLFRVLMSASYSGHALNNHNRRFYFDATYSTLKPIYYDGNSNILRDERLLYPVNPYYLRGLRSEDLKLAINRLDSIDIASFGKQLSASGLYMQEEKILQVLYEMKARIRSMRAALPSSVNRTSRQPVLSQLYQSGFGSIVSTGDQVVSCSAQDLCQESDLAPTLRLKYVQGKYSKKGRKYLYLGHSNTVASSAPVDRLKSISLIGQDVSVKVTGDPLVEVDVASRMLRFTSYSPSDRILLSGGKLKDWSIIVASPLSDKTPLGVRYNTNLLTSTLTLMDVYVEGLNITSEGGLHEDAVNFVRVKGSIDLVDIKDSRQDAFDADFSDVSVSKLNVVRAGNDCLDVSAGEYRFDSASFNGCLDKAVSVGEGAKVIANSIQIDGAEAGFVVKDSSIAVVDHLHIQNVLRCLSLYRKKPEFASASLRWGKIICHQRLPSFVQRGSNASTK